MMDAANEGKGEGQKGALDRDVDAVAASLAGLQLPNRTSPGAEGGDSLASSPGDAAGTGAGREKPRRAGVILDLHYLQVAALQFTLRTTWDPHVLEAVVARLLQVVVVERRGADSDLSQETADRDTVRKQGLHDRLRDAGYALALSPNKRSGGGRGRQQGATDVEVAMALFELAGAFAQRPLVDVIVLVAGDFDFQPAVERVLAARPELEVVVVATDSSSSLRREYREWLAGHPRSRLLDLREVLQAMAPNVVDLQAGPLPTAAGIVGLVAARLQELSRSAASPSPASSQVSTPIKGSAPARSPGKRGDSRGRRSSDRGDGLVLHLSNRGRQLNDKMMTEIADGITTVIRADPRLSPWLDQLWVHHTDIGDRSCGALGALITAAQLTELHISDTGVTAAGLRQLTDAATAGGYGDRSRRGMASLYINAAHIPEEAGPESVEGVHMKLLRKRSGRSLFDGARGRGGPVRGGFRGRGGQGGRGGVGAQGRGGRGSARGRGDRSGGRGGFRGRGTAGRGRGRGTNGSA